MYPDPPNIPQRWMYTAARDSAMYSAQLNRKVWIRDYAAVATKVLACGICSLGTLVVCVDQEFECTLPDASFVHYSSSGGVTLKWSTFWLRESIVILRLRTKVRKLHYIVL